MPTAKSPTSPWMSQRASTGPPTLYTCHTMQGTALPLTEFITGIRQFVIPVFQRAYSWTEEHCAQLWHDVLDASRSGSTHFFGTAVVIPTSDGTRHLVVDGQQRLATVLLLLVALRNRIGDVRGPDCPSAASIDADFLRDHHADAYAGDIRYKLLLRGPDHNTFRRLLDGSEPARGTSRALDVAHDYFAKSITNKDPAVIWRGVQRLEIVEVRLERGIDDPQAVFESLNSTGMTLRTSDLVRNFILMKLDEPQQTHLYDLHWSELDRMFKGNEAVFDDFIRDYLDMTTGRKIPTRSDRIYRDFRRFWRTSIDRNEKIDSALCGYGTTRT